MVRLASPAQLNDRVNTLCLPDDDVTVSAHSHCYTTGWGLTYRDAGNQSLEQVLNQMLGICVVVFFYYFRFNILFRRSGNWPSRSQDDLDRRQWMPERLVEPRRGTSLFRLQQSVHHSLSGELLVSKAINYELITIVSWLAICCDNTLMAKE